MRIGIVGVGGVGSMAAWRLADAGHEVLAFEQFEIDHDLGSSYGGSRVVRQAYNAPFYSALMGRSFELWAELQSRYPSSSLIERRGGLFFGPTGHSRLTEARQALRSCGAEFSELTASEVNERFPGIRLENDESALYEYGMGYARASNAILAAAEIARNGGAQIFEQCAVRSIDLQTDVLVTTEDEVQISLDKLIICAGPWTNRVLAGIGISLPLSVTRQVYCHLESPTELYESGTFPVWMDCADHHYGFPHIADESGVKFAQHVQGASANPDNVPRSATSDDVQPLIEYAQRRLPSLLPNVISSKVCLYTNTPDEDFVIDFLPSDSRVVIVSACSGHGFKFVPIIGEMAKQMVTEGESAIDRAPFSLSRFS